MVESSLTSAPVTRSGEDGAPASSGRPAGSSGRARLDARAVVAPGRGAVAGTGPGESATVTAVVACEVCGLVTPVPGPPVCPACGSGHG